MKKIITLIVLALVIVSCALESTYSLPKNNNIDRSLIGTWVLKNEGELIIKMNEDQTFSITMIDEKGENNIVSPNAYTSNIKNYKLINLVSTSKKGEITNVFYNYRISGDHFRFRNVSDQFSDRKITSNADLLSYFEENISKQGFFGNWEEPFIKK